MLRIARTKKSDFLNSDQNEESLFSHHSRIYKIVKKHLSAVTASVFSKPKFIENSNDIEWYSDLKGQPQPLLTTSNEQQSLGKKLLSDRLNAISKLADQLPQLEPGSVELQSLLRKAIQYPGDAAIYLVNNQPVITNWGIPDTTTNSATTSLPYSTKTHTNINSPSKKTPSAFFKYLIWLLVLLLLLGLIGYWFAKKPDLWQKYNPFINEYQLLLDEINTAGNNCSTLAHIHKNNPFINKPEERFTLLKINVEYKINACEAFKQLLKDIKLANKDCEKLTEISKQNQFLKSPKDRFIPLKEHLQLQIKNCNKAEILMMLRTLPEFLGAEFVGGFAVFTNKTKTRALKEMALIGRYLSKNKQASVLITLHTPVPGPDYKDSFTKTSGFKDAKSLLTARLNSVINSILKVPDVSRKQINHNSFKYNRNNRSVTFKISHTVKKTI